MTHEETIKRIQELVPSIMELEFGCEVEEKPAFGSSMRHDTFNGGKVFKIVCKDNSGNWLYLTDGGFGREKEDKILNWHTILGKPITLAVVMLAINKSREHLRDRYAVKVSSSGFMEDCDMSNAKGTGKWNLSKDNFNDQSEETKSFIRGLLGN